MPLATQRIKECSRKLHTQMIKHNVKVVLKQEKIIKHSRTTSEDEALETSSRTKREQVCCGFSLQPESNSVCLDSALDYLSK